MSGPLRCIAILYVDDLIEGFIRLMDTPDDFTGPVNLGNTGEFTIRELAELVAEVVGFHGQLVFDASKPDGTPRKLLDVSHLQQLGWQPKTGFREGIVLAYTDFLKNVLKAV